MSEELQKLKLELENTKIFFELNTEIIKTMIKFKNRKENSQAIRNMIDENIQKIIIDSHYDYMKEKIESLEKKIFKIDINSDIEFEIIF